MSEFYVKNKYLIEEKEWKQIINSLKTNESLADPKKAHNTVKKLIKKAIKERIPKEPFGILFSGGLDSALIALICKQLKADFICYSVGFYDQGQKYPVDLIFAKKLAEEIDVELKMIVLDFKESEKIIKKIVKILKGDQNNVTNVGVGTVLMAALEAAKKDNINILFSGLGAEELFAGYERHIGYDKKDYSKVQEECWKGLLGMYQRDFIRDISIAEQFKAELQTPFLDMDLIKEAMKIPAKLKINKQYKKLILREVAENIGLPKEYAWRKKLAAQYGARTTKAVQKLARKAGFRYKKDYLKSLERST
ncbi:MAG: asparagine synthase C-terminal domain-containing protein [archaeon]